MKRLQVGEFALGFMMARQYPICITQAQAWELPWKESRPYNAIGISGVYMVVGKESGEVIYVGQSKNIGTRIRAVDHPCRSTKEKLIVLPVDDVDERGCIERTLIVLFKPPLNEKQGDRRIGEENLYTPIYTEYLKEWHAKVHGR